MQNVFDSQDISIHDILQTLIDGNFAAYRGGVIGARVPNFSLKGENGASLCSRHLKTFDIPPLPISSISS